MPIKDLLDEPKNRIKQLEKLLEQQQRTIETLRGYSKRKFKAAGSRKLKGGFTRVFYGDIHGAYVDRPSLEAFLGDLRELKPREMINVGDMVSCDGFLAEHHTINVLPQLDYSYDEDTQVANEIFDAIHTAAPQVRRHEYIEGNHENRIIRTITNKITKNPRDAKLVERQLGVANLLNLKKRGIRFIRRDQYYDGLSISGTIKVEPYAVAQHGEAYCGVNASRQLMHAVGSNIFHGHTHRLLALYGETMAQDMVVVNTGCLCQKRPLYGLTKTTGWMPGYAVEFVDPAHGFLAIPIPIVNGVSYLAPLLKMLRG